MNYFSKKTQEYQSKNGLQHYLLDQLRQYDQLLVESAAKFQQIIEVTVANANRRYPRCKPAAVSSWMSPAKLFAKSAVNEMPDFNIHIGELVYFSLYSIKGELSGQPGELFEMIASSQSTVVTAQIELPLFAEKEASHD